jgi:hypothetical protein
MCGGGLPSTSYTNGSVCKKVLECILSCVSLSNFHYCHQSLDNAVGAEEFQPMDTMIPFLKLAKNVPVFN